MIDESQIEYLLNGERADADTLNRPLRQIVSAVNASVGAGSGLFNHAQLLGRNDDNAHPISAITGLQEALSGVRIKQQYESNPDTNAFTDDEKAKLTGIATGATKNQTDSYLLDRANHTGTQPVSTITGLGTAATRNVGTGHGEMMAVGAYGIGGLYINANIATGSYIGRYSPEALPVGYPASWYPYGSILSMYHGYAGTSAEIVIPHTPRGGIKFRHSRDVNFIDILHTDNILHTTGQSTQYPMTQKAVTDQLATKAASSHTHPWSQVTEQPDTATRWPTWSEVTDKPSTFAPVRSTNTADGGIKTRLVGDVLYMTNDGNNA